MEEFFHKGIDQAQDRAEGKRTDDLQHRVDEHRNDADRYTAGKALGNAEGDRKDDQTNCVVQGDNRQEDIDQGALRLILVHDHQSRSRSRSSGDRTKGQSHRDRDLIRHKQMQDQN